MKTIVSLLAVALMAAANPALASSGAMEPKQMEWAFDGVFGKFDKPSIQRGFQVYKEVCSACHSLKRVPFRKLTDVGFSEAEVKSLAASYQIHDGPNDMGEMFDRPGRPSDHFPSPYANDNAARNSNGGALPPDQSLLIKSREDGPNYIYSLLTGYSEAPAYRCGEVTEGKCTKFDPVDAKDAAAEIAQAQAIANDAKPAGKNPTSAPTAAAEASVTVGQIFYCSDVTHKKEKNKDGVMVESQECHEMGKTMHYNPYFPGKQIAMAAPLRDDSVTYQDETKATVDQEAHDVVNFLQWAAEPEMEERKRMGIHVMLFLGIMTCFFYVVKKRVWSDLH